jgi:hypothetical protein
MKKIKGLKKACSEINNNRNLYNRVMFDMGDKTVWIDSFPSSNSWNDYHDKNIINAGNVPEGIWDGYAHVSMSQIQDMIIRAVAQH